ncbi:MAG: hypothetical protein HN712_10250 [Gemmatimonadetes bacterium]|nr:hypothetical protein [Gemmatimonadota bacterium]MBT7860684.1 hypothetical protein [Gemmatimonadota bacterium]
MSQCLARQSLVPVSGSAEILSFYYKDPLCDVDLYPGRTFFEEAVASQGRHRTSADLAWRVQGV